MLASSNRLRKAADIDRVYKRGRFGGGQQLQIKALATHRPESRAVIVVGKKISKKAVVRNAIRRRLSGQLEELWQTVAPGYDIVISVRDDLSKAPPAELRAHLAQALTKLNLINTKN